MATSLRLCSPETAQAALAWWRDLVFDNEKLTGNHMALEFARASRDAVASHQETLEMVVAEYLNRKTLGLLGEPFFPKPKSKFVKATCG